MHDPDSSPADKELIAQAFEIPSFKPYIKAEDLDGLEDRDRRLLLAISVLEQKIDFALRRLQENSHHQQHMERELLRMRASQQELKRGFSLTKGAALTLGAGISAELLHLGIKRLFG
jgi:hypothetical protein